MTQIQTAERKQTNQRRAARAAKAAKTPEKPVLALHPKTVALLQSPAETAPAAKAEAKGLPPIVKRKKTAKPAANGDGRHKAKATPKAAANDDRKITLLVAENPKRPQSAAHKRFSAYKQGMTVAAARQAGITAKDLRYDTVMGYIKIG